MVGGQACKLNSMFLCVLHCGCKMLSPFMGMFLRGMWHQSPTASSETPRAASGSGRRQQAGTPLADQKLWRANGEFVRVLWPARLTVAHAFPTQGYPGDYDSVLHGASDRAIHFSLRSRQRTRSSGCVVEPAVLIITGPHGRVMQFYDELRLAVGSHLGNFLGLPAASRIVLRELTAVAIGDVLPAVEEPEETQPQGPPVDIDMQRLRELGENEAKALRVLYTQLSSQYVVFGDT